MALGKKDPAAAVQKYSMSEDKWLTRLIFLESIAGVPGMVGGMVRHLHSLRVLRRDNGWIATLLEESQNERMHLLTFLKFREPGVVMRVMLLGAQGCVSLPLPLQGDADTATGCFLISSSSSTSSPHARATGSLATSRRKQ